MIKDIAIEYLRKGGINPWGGAEADVSRKIARRIKKPVAHAPLDSGAFNDFHEVVNPRMAAELVSVSYLHCVLRGLHDAPRPINSVKGIGINVDSVVAMVTPIDTYGIPHVLCLDYGIPIIAVRDNTVLAKNRIAKCDQFVEVENYLEAAGLLMAMKSGVTVQSVKSSLLSAISSGASFAICHCLISCHVPISKAPNR